MRHKTIILLLVLLLSLPVIAGAVSEKDFEVHATKDIINLCTASPEDPLYQQAINFCHGYLVGAFHYHEASVAGPEVVQLVCMPDTRPSRNATISMFIDWAKARPQYWDGQRSR